MARKIVVSLFENLGSINATIDQLEAANVDRSDIDIISDSASQQDMSGAQSDDDYAAPIITGAPVVPVVPVAGAAAPILGAPGTDVRSGPTPAQKDRAVAEHTASIANRLEEEGIDQEDARAYAHGVSQGGVLLVVRCDEADVRQIVRIVKTGGASRIGER